MPRIGSLHNDYAGELGELLDATPKAVIAAIAVSALSGGGDYLEHARSKFAREWELLHGNGIVPQPLPARFRSLAEEAATREDE